MIPLATVAAYASQIAGTTVTLACDIPPSFPYDGYVWFPDGVHPESVIHLRPGICVRLEHAQELQAFSPADWLILEHEALHIALASTDECFVERVALANTWQLVRLFRMAAWKVQEILQGVVAADRAMPAEYHPDANGAC